MHSTCDTYLLTDKGLSTTMCPAANMKCRNTMYPRSQVERFSVPDDKVDWSVDWPEYRPPTFTSPYAIGKPWADPEHRYWSMIVIQIFLTEIFYLLL